MTGKFLRATVFGDDEMKAALDWLNGLVDSEERFVIAATYANAQQTAQTVTGINQKLETMSSKH